MSRLPFDPDRAAGPPSEPDQPARRERPGYRSVADAEHITVGQLSQLIKTTLEERIASPIRVIGQVSNLSQRQHWYFSLKDEDAVIGCVAWASSAKKFGFTPGDGDEVVATGHVSHFGPQGRTQLYVRELRPVGEGALMLRFKQMCEELRQLGYFDEGLKRDPPLMPQRIAVITSAGGAAVQDVIATAGQRCRAVGLLVVDVRVQGDGAAGEVARAIRWVDANHRSLNVDAILVTRGGGSIEDLWAFNEREVADAAYACSVPLVAAIGHESDTTVIELVADRRASTPTQAAVLLVPSGDELRQQVDHFAHRLDFNHRRMIETARQRLDGLARHELFRRPGAAVAAARRYVDDLHRTLRRSMEARLLKAETRLEKLCGRFAQRHPAMVLEKRAGRLAVLEDRLNRAARARVAVRPQLEDRRRRMHLAMRRRLTDARHDVDALGRELDAIDPRRVLARGFSYTTRKDGELVRSIRHVKTGDLLVTNLADGTVQSTVGGAAGRPGRKPRRPDDGSDDHPQMDLF
jgi:exodeoxyribonuclease VII large subunit